MKSSISGPGQSGCVFAAVQTLCDRDAVRSACLRGLTGPEHYFELRYKLQKDMERVPALVEETGREYERLFGRYLGAVEDYRCDDAEIILVTSERRATPPGSPWTR